MLQNISLKTKLISALSLLILINFIVGGYIFYMVKRAEANMKGVEQTARSTNAVVTLESLLVSTHRSQAAFLNSGDLANKEAYLKGKEAVSHYTVEALDIIQLSELRDDIMSVGALIKQWENEIVNKQLAYMQSPSTVDLARLYEASEQNAIIWKGIAEKFEIASEILSEQTYLKSSQLTSAMNSTVLAVVIGAVLSMITAAIAAVFLIGSISSPLTKLVTVTNRLVNKEWDVEVEGTQGSDEISQMAQALLQFRNNGIENERLIQEQQEEDTKRLTRAKRIEDLVEAFRSESDEVTQAVELATENMKGSSDMMTQIADDTSTLSENVSKTAQSAGNNVNNVAAACEQLTASINEISVQLNRTSQKAINAQEVTNSTSDKMKVLEASANEIGNVIEIINDIAEQTNLLALNATIEAARAGEAGKGFAVVASEVKGLAGQTAKATEQVQQQIDRIQADTTEAVQLMAKISSTIEELNEAATTIASAMEEQNTATQDISRNVSEASQGTNEVVTNIMDVSKAARETRETSQNVNKISVELSQRAGTLKQSIQKFIENIKAA